VQVQTNSQKMAQQAYQQIDKRQPNEAFKSFAREFPSLIHACGLAQAVAFARAKGDHQEDYLSDLAAVLKAGAHNTIKDTDQLAAATRDNPVATYIRLSRDALQAAGWLKRYVEAYDHK
jgi:CRISPR-associated protein Cmr5